MALMTENRLRHWPVMDGDQLIGLVSIGDHTAFGIQGMRASVVRATSSVTQALI